MGGRHRPKNQMIAFRSAIEDNILFDLGCRGIFLRGVTHMQMTVIRMRDKIE